MAFQRNGLSKDRAYVTLYEPLRNPSFLQKRFLGHEIVQKYIKVNSDCKTLGYMYMNLEN